MSDIEKKRDLFANAPVKTAVCKQVIPAVAGMMVTLIYGLADTYFVGYVNDPAQTAALNVSGPCFLMLTAVSNLFGVGGASLIAQALGKKELVRAKEISVAASYCGAIAALFYSALMYLFMYPILQICGADSQSFPHASGYTMWTVVIGAFGTVMNILFGNLVRAEGDAVAASFGVTLGGVLNIFLDALFVLPRFLGMGAVGAGIATALSNYAAALYFIIYIIVKRKGSVISLSPSFFLRGVRSLGEICKIGFPSALQYALTVVAIAAQAGFVSKYGVEAEAGLGIVKKLDQLPLYFSIGVSNGLLPILAFNYAAENYVRQKDA
ncbi:MAG: hypothetical protein HUJ86_06935, partial [Synergistes sp.]|nr:hypothetical protein [Synergistes sp.]